MISRNGYGSYGTIDSNASTSTSGTHSRTKSYNAPSTTFNNSGIGGGYQSTSGISSSGYDSSQHHASSSSSLLSTNHLKGMFKKSNSHQDVDSQRIGTLDKNNYYDRAKMRRDENNYVWKAIQDMIQYLMGFVDKPKNGAPGSGYEQPEIYLEPHVKKQMEDFKELVTQRYDSSSVAHETRLMDLWRACMGSEELTSRVSEQWKDIGFQGKDPNSDFRAAGVWALQNLLYFSETYPKKFKRMVKKTRHEKNAYPFAIAAINVTMLLLQVLGVHKRGDAHNLQSRKAFIDMLFEPDLPFRTVDDDIRELHGGSVYGSDMSNMSNSPHAQKKKQKELVLLAFDEEQEQEAFIDFNDDNTPSTKKDSRHSSTRRKRLYKTYNCVFEELFVCTFVALDTYWWRSQSHYFNFPEVLKMTRRKMENLLDKEFTDIGDLRRHNKKVCSSKREQRK
mmetsp:Transcript_5810/g.22046  ORF Transcript_5810/g.22046 Transcript_5810/m.22046 type:complete len:448 (+) Transcript_5810:267-1610(+)